MPALLSFISVRFEINLGRFAGLHGESTLAFTGASIILSARLLKNTNDSTTYVFRLFLLVLKVFWNCPSQMFFFWFFKTRRETVTLRDTHAIYHLVTNDRTKKGRIGDFANLRRAPNHRREVVKTLTVITFKNCRRRRSFLPRLLNIPVHLQKDSQISTCYSSHTKDTRPNHHVCPRCRC